MKLSYGYFKVESNFSEIDGGCHYFRVIKLNGVKHLIIDNRMPIPLTDPSLENAYLRGFRLIEDISPQNPIVVNNLKLTFSWKDKNGDQFQMSVSNQIELDHFWRQFPRVKKAFYQE